MTIPKSVEAFDENILEGKLKLFADLTSSLGSPLLTEQVWCLNDLQLIDIPNNSAGWICAKRV